MVEEVMVEVDDGLARIRVAAWAGSIRRTVDVAGAYYPDAGPGEWIRGGALVRGAS